MESMLPPSYEAAKGGNVTASAPSINTEDKLDGGENAMPNIPSAPPLETPNRLHSLNLGALNEEDLRKACYSFVTDHCCYGSKFVTQMVVTGINNGCTFHYKLESFGEKRESTKRFTPYFGQTIDGPENGSPPDPWDISVPDPVKFVDSRTTKEIPHTAYVKVCGTCVGNGQVRCSWCSGSGTSSCWSCSGSGKNSDDETCSSCGGSGSERCSSCSGSGMVTCSTCNGHGKLKHYRLLIVTWKNHPEDFISNTMNLPRDLIRDATGKEILREVQKKLEPISHAPESTINEASYQLLKKHNSSFRDELIIWQRHHVRVVPIAKATYQWREKEGEFFVYGLQRKVYFEDYPQQCCCCPCF